MVVHPIQFMLVYLGLEIILFNTFTLCGSFVQFGSAGFNLD